MFPGGQSNYPKQADLQVSAGHRRHNPTQDPQGPLEGLPHREAQPGAVQAPRHAQGLQHQWQDQPDGDPRPPAHAPLLEGESKVGNYRISKSA